MFMPLVETSINLTNVDSLPVEVSLNLNITNFEIISNNITYCSLVNLKNIRESFM